METRLYTITRIAPGIHYNYRGGYNCKASAFADARSLSKEWGSAVDHEVYYKCERIASFTNGRLSWEATK